MKRKLLLLLVPLVFFAFWLCAGPFSGGNGPFPQKGIPGIYVTNNGAGYTNPDGTITVNAPGGSGTGLPGTNAIAVYGDARNTNGLGSFLGLDGVMSNANGSVTALGGLLSASSGVKVTGGSPGILVSNTLGAGGSYMKITTNGVIQWTNAEQGVWGSIGTNSTIFMSNAIVGAYTLLSPTNLVYSNATAFLQITNGHITVTNYTAAGQSVDIDPSVPGTILYGDRTRANYLNVSVNSVLISNNTFQVGGQSFLSNSAVITAGGTFITGLETNVNAIIYNTNTQGNIWSPTVDATKPVQLMTMFTSNLTINGISGLELVHNFNPVTLVTNSDTTPHQIVFPAGTRVMQALGTNQPVASASVTCTNGKTLEIDWLIYPHLGQDVTNAKVWIQTN